MVVGIFVCVFGFLFQVYILPMDENGKYTFSEVVEVEGKSKEELYKNGIDFMKKIKVLKSKKKHYKMEKENYTIINKGSFYVYRIGSVKKGTSGAVKYDIVLEIKEGKYRYTITNFEFNEYQKNRYGKYEPVNRKLIPLEKEVSSINKKEWEYHKQVVYDKSLKLIQNLYSAMTFPEEKIIRKEKNDNDW